jgi:hypothetical protein
MAQQMTDLVERVADAISEGCNYALPPFLLDRCARAAVAAAQEEFAKIAESVKVHANGHPQIDAPTLGDMRRAIVAAIRGEASK